MPSAGFEEEYLHGDIFLMAAAYLFHIVQNHPFVDGNKRTGAVTCVYFLGMNDIEFTAEPDDFENMVCSVARGELEKPEIAAFLREHGRPSN